MNFCDLLPSESPQSRANLVLRYRDTLKIEWIFDQVNYQGGSRFAKTE